MIQYKVREADGRFRLVRIDNGKEIGVNCFWFDNNEPTYPDKQAALDAARAECARLNGLEDPRLTESEESIKVLANDISRSNGAIIGMIDDVKQRLAALEAKDKPAPEPGEFVVEEVWKAQSTEDITIFTRIDKTGRYLCFTDNQVEIRLNAYEAMKEAIRGYLFGPTLGESIETLRERMAIIDDYEARE